MVRVFLRSFYPYPSYGGQAFPHKLVSCAPQWKKFEALLKECLGELGCDIIEQQAHPEVADLPHDAELRIYAHKTRRDVSGDVFYKQMHLPELLTIDRQGWGADHSRMKSPLDLSFIDRAAAERFVASLSARLRDAGVSKHPQPARAGPLLLPPDYIFVPLQTPRDYVQLHHAAIKVLDFIHLLAGWGAASKQHIVFKLHPFLLPEPDHDIIRAVEQHAAASDFISCVNANIHDLIHHARGVFTINSGVGFESLIQGKPVVTFGNCDYSRVTFHAHPGNLAAAREFVFSHPENSRRETCAFLYYYYFHHALSVADEHVEATRARLFEYLGCALSK